MLKIVFAIVVSALTFSKLAQAQTSCASYPYPFPNISNGSVADANQVRLNFNAIMNCANTLAPLVSPDFYGPLYVNITGNIANTNVQIDGSATVIEPNASSQSGMGAVAWNFYNNGNSPSWSGTLINHMGSAYPGNLYGLTAASQGNLLFQNVSSGVIASNGANIFISPAGAPSASFLSNGDVGIGTTSPWATLTVQSATGQLALNGTNGSTAGIITFYDNGTPAWSLLAYHPNGDFYLQNNGASTNMVVASGTNSWAAASDVRLKKNIKTLSVLDRLADYRAVSFDWKQTGKHDLGVIAQELYKTFPEVVNKGSDGVLSDPADKGRWSVQYDKLGAFALEAAKELKAENDALRAANDVQGKDIGQLKDMAQQQQNQIDALKTQIASLIQAKVASRE